MIREATYNDIQPMLELGQAMHAESRYRALPWDTLKVWHLISTLIASDDGLALVAVRGDKVIGGFLGAIEEHWCTTARSSADYALFLHPDYRGGMTAPMLLRRYRTWATERGVAPELLCAGITTGVKVESSGRLFEQCGFEYAGPMFVARASA